MTSSNLDPRRRVLYWRANAERVAIPMSQAPAHLRYASGREP